MRRPFRYTLGALMLVLVVIAAACGDDDDDTSSTSDSTTASTAATGDTTTGDSTAASDAPSDESATVRIALDWTPNTNHTGIFVAQEQGLYEAAGLDVEILPYSTTSADTLVGSGVAECGVSFQDSVAFSRLAGAPVVSVLAVLQHWGTEIAVRADRDDITSPADLDGLTYAGFGLPSEVPILEEVIRNAGGTGEFETVVLSTSAYEALYSGDVDFTVPFVAWEGIEAGLRGEPIKTFAYTDYGFPDMYQVVIICNEDWIAENPETAAAFVGALAEGYQFAVDNPDEAAQLLIDANPDAFTETELVTLSQEMLSADYMLDADGKFGTQTLAQWTDFTRFLYEAGLFADVDGNPITEEPDYSQFFTNDLLPTS